MEISRRDFLALTAAAGVGLPGARVALAHGAAPAPARPRTINIFSKHLQWLEYDAMAELAAEIGFDGVDLTVRPGGHVLPERVERDLPRAVEAVQRAGLAVPLITTGIVDPRDPLTEAILRTASGLGVTHYRMGYLRYPADVPVAEALEGHRGTMRELAALNQRYGLHGAYQNHSGTNVGGPVWDIHALLHGLDPRWSGVQYDIRHATVEGGTSWPLGLRLLHPYAQTTAVKDFHWARDDQGRWRIKNVPLGEGMVNWDAYWAMVKQLGVAGPIALHIEYPPFEGVRERLTPAEMRRQGTAVMRHDLARLRAMLAAAGLA